MKISSIEIERGRSFELDRVDVGRATITAHDLDGTLDPTNPTSPFWNIVEDHTRLQPLKQARISMWNPITHAWHTRYRGFVEAWSYEYDPSQRFQTMTITLVDLFEIVQTVEMFPGFFGHTCPPEHAGNVFFEDTATSPPGHGMQVRVYAILKPGGYGTPATLGGCGIPDAFFVVFSGNVELHESTYSPATSAMDAIQEAVDAEFPGVGNIYCDRNGVLQVHGRFARFDPVGTAAATAGWDFNDWAAGDGAVVGTGPTTHAHIRAFGISRDLGKVINQATASPISALDGAAYETKVLAQTVENTTSKGHYGIRPWSVSNLATKLGVTDGNIDDWDETKLFGQYYVDNYHAPEDRVTSITFRSSALDAIGTAANWDFLCRCDLNDRVYVSIGAAGGGGYLDEPYFIEGIHETIVPMGPDAFDNVTLTLDLSPAAYFVDSPFAT